MIERFNDKSTKPEKKPEQVDVGRRNFLFGAGALATAAGIAALNSRFGRQEEPLSSQKPETKEDAPALNENFLDNVEKHPRQYHMSGDLIRVRRFEFEKTPEGVTRKIPVHAQFGKPLNTMMGVNEAEPVIHVDYRYQLAQLLKGKIERIKKETGDVSQGQLRVIRKVFDSYKVPERQQAGIEEYRIAAAHSIRDVRSSIDFSRLPTVAELKDIGEHGMKLFRQLEQHINATSLITYALTEVMPNAGRTGVETFDFLLRNAGRQYIESFPALYDRYLSFGPYQFTSLALYDAGGKRGASLINGICKPSQIPGSVSKLEGNQHHKAAYLFAVYNLAALVNSLDEDTCKALTREPCMKAVTPDVVLQYIAAAHHLPVNARNAFSDYADQLIAHYKPRKKGTEAPKVQQFGEHASKRKLGTYVQKTQAHSATLYDLYKW